MENVFTEDQLLEIEEGKKEGLDVEKYARPEFLAIQMREIRLGLLKKLPVEVYARTEYDWFQMQELRLGLEKGLDVKKYAEPKISFARCGRSEKVWKTVWISLSAGTFRLVF